MPGSLEKEAVEENASWLERVQRGLGGVFKCLKAVSGTSPFAGSGPLTSALKTVGAGNKVRTGCTTGVTVAAFITFSRFNYTASEDAQKILGRIFRGIEEGSDDVRSMDDKSQASVHFGKNHFRLACLAVGFSIAANIPPAILTAASLYSDTSLIRQWLSGTALDFDGVYLGFTVFGTLSYACGSVLPTARDWLDLIQQHMEGQASCSLPLVTSIILAGLALTPSTLATFKGFEALTASIPVLSNSALDETIITLCQALNAPLWGSAVKAIIECNYKVPPSYGWFLSGVATLPLISLSAYMSEAHRIQKGEAFDVEHQQFWQQSMPFLLVSMVTEIPLLASGFRGAPSLSSIASHARNAASTVWRALTSCRRTTAAEGEAFFPQRDPEQQGRGCCAWLFGNNQPNGIAEANDASSIP